MEPDLKVFKDSWAQRDRKEIRDFLSRDPQGFQGQKVSLKKKKRETMYSEDLCELNSDTFIFWLQERRALLVTRVCQVMVLRDEEGHQAAPGSLVQR